MKRFCTTLMVVLNCGVAFATTVDFSEYTQVTPTNAAKHGIKFFYHAPIPALVTVEMPYTKGKQRFDEAVLEFAGSEEHFKIPVAGKRQEKNTLLVAFWMDRQKLRQSSLRISFSKKVEIKPTVYVLSLRDFVTEVEKTSER